MMLKKILAINKYKGYFEVVWGLIVLKNILRIRGVKIDANGRYFGLPIISLMKGSSIIIGKNCILCSKSNRTALGVNHPVILKTLSNVASITIGDETGISGGTICAVTLVQIGRECLIGANVTIADTDFHPIRPIGKRYLASPSNLPSSPVIIEDNVFIGAGVIVLKGVRIGQNSVIGAGSVVSRSVPPNTIAAGNPAKVIKYL